MLDWNTVDSNSVDMADRGDFFWGFSSKSNRITAETFCDSPALEDGRGGLVSEQWKVQMEYLEMRKPLRIVSGGRTSSIDYMLGLEDKMLWKSEERAQEEAEREAERMRARQREEEMRSRDSEMRSRDLDQDPRKN